MNILKKRFLEKRENMKPFDWTGHNYVPYEFVLDNVSLR